jgi:hypothetical protein
VARTAVQKGHDDPKMNHPLGRQSGRKKERLNCDKTLVTISAGGELVVPASHGAFLSES